MLKTLILLENEQLDYSLDLIEAANRLGNTEVYGLLLNNKVSDIRGLDYLIKVNNPELHYYDSKSIAQLVEQAHERFDFDSILILATSLGRMIAPRVAMRLKTGLVADITNIQIENDGPQFIRPAFSGNMLANIICDTKPMMASIHPNVFHRKPDKKTPQTINFTFKIGQVSSIEVKTTMQKEKNIDIRQSDVLVAFGGGYQGNAKELEDLAQLLDGSVAASKRPVDNGLAPRAIQVGQSGKTVSPKLYLALGIFGSMQHIEGLKNVEHILSVNTSKAAAMNYLGDIVVIGDAQEFVQKLKNKIEKKEE